MMSRRIGLHTSEFRSTTHACIREYESNPRSPSRIIQPHTSNTLHVNIYVCVYIYIYIYIYICIHARITFLCKLLGMRQSILHHHIVRSNSKYIFLRYAFFESDIFDLNNSYGSCLLRTASRIFARLFSDHSHEIYCTSRK